MSWRNVCYELEESVLCSLEAPVVVYVNIYIVWFCSTSSECVTYK